VGDDFAYALPSGIKFEDRSVLIRLGIVSAETIPGRNRLIASPVLAEPLAVIVNDVEHLALSNDEL
jgi:hypothetical protein